MVSDSISWVTTPKTHSSSKLMCLSCDQELLNGSWLPEYPVTAGSAFRALPSTLREQGRAEGAVITDEQLVFGHYVGIFFFFLRDCRLETSSPPITPLGMLGWQRTSSPGQVQHPQVGGHLPGLSGGYIIKPFTPMADTSQAYG